MGKKEEDEESRIEPFTAKLHGTHLVLLEEEDLTHTLFSAAFFSSFPSHFSPFQSLLHQYTIICIYLYLLYAFDL